MTVPDIISELESLGNPATKQVLMRHGAREPFFGVKVGDMKPIQKRIKKNYALSLELFDTGISDAMYLAGLISDSARMTRADLDHWADGAYWHMISEYSVAWTASESPFAQEKALAWIGSDQERIACAGWSTYSAYIAITPDERLDLPEIAGLLEHISQHLHQAPNRVRYTMNGFVISAGTYISDLQGMALDTARMVGKVAVEMGGTACKVPEAISYIQKSQKDGVPPPRRKTVRC